MDRTLEKVALAKELKLDGFVEYTEFIKKETTLKFKPITKSEVRKKIRNGFGWRKYFIEFYLAEKDLSNWEENLPYGALLAVKEAKEQGLKNFKILYPEKWGSQERFIADPVIVGLLGNKAYEVFAWDDGKVYE